MPEILFVPCGGERKTGEWIDVARDPDEILEEVESLIGAEWSIHSANGFYDLNEDVGKCHDLDEISGLACLIDKHGESYATYVEEFMADWDDECGYEQAYNGTWRDEEEFAEDLFWSLADIPDFISSYIDWESVAKDLFIGDYTSYPSYSGGVFVYRNY